MRDIFVLVVACCGLASAQVFSPVLQYGLQQSIVDQPTTIIAPAPLIPYSTTNAVKHTPQIPYAPKTNVVTTTIATTAVASPYTLTTSLIPYSTTPFPPASSSILPVSSSISLPASSSILPASSSLLPTSSSILPVSAPFMPYTPYIPTTTTTDTITASTVVPLVSTSPVVQLYTPARAPNNVVVDSRGNAHNVFRYGPRQSASAGNVLKPVDPDTAATLSNQGKPVLASQPDVPIPSNVITGQGIPLVTSYGPATTTTTTTTTAATAPAIPYIPPTQLQVMPYVPRISNPAISLVSSYGPPAPAVTTTPYIPSSQAVSLVSSYGPASAAPATSLFPIGAFVYGPAPRALYPASTSSASPFTSSSQTLLPSATAVYSPSSSTSTAAPPLPYVPIVSAGMDAYRPPRDVTQDFGVTPGNAALYVPASSSLSTAPRPIYVSQTTSVPAYVSQPTPVYMPQPVYQPTPAYAPAPAPFSVPAANSPTPMRAATASPTTYVMPFGWGFRATNLTRPTPAPTLAPTRGKSLSDMQRDALRQRPLNVTEIVMGLKQPAVVSFDFDGTLQNVTVGRSVGTAYPQVLDFLKQLGAAGAQVIITTARTTDDNPLIEDFLNRNNATQYVTQIYNTETSDKTGALLAAGAQVHVDDRANVLAHLQTTAPSIKLFKVGDDGSVAAYR